MYTFKLDALCSSERLLNDMLPRLRNLDDEYVILQLADVDVTWVDGAVEKMIDGAWKNRASIVFSNYFDRLPDGNRREHPLISWTEGAVRDDFDFGGVILVNAAMLKAAFEALDCSWRFAAFYALKLALLRQGKALRCKTPLYFLAHRQQGEKSQFDYVDPRNRDVQLEMESACTRHLEAIGATVNPSEFPDEDFSGDFPVEASVIIPVKNRCTTIVDAVKSALSQVTDFDFNVIVVDNWSTDGTSQLLDMLAQDHPRLHHLVPESRDHGIGGCWNEALRSPHCGRFAVQLDSDDVYSVDSSLQRIVDEFRRRRCAMVVGSYILTDFDRNVIPPGLISHSEWTDDNGPNNALRINGFGAPRAFFTPVAREIGFPDVSYGEDYAMCLAVSRSHRVGRIFDPLYLCRRWSGNSDASLSIEAQNRNNEYKDSVRTEEVIMRKRLNEIKRRREAMKSFVDDQMAAWPEAAARHEALSTASTKKVDVAGVEWNVVLNPSRIVSTAAKTDAASIEARPCFLCAANRPSEQRGLRWRDYDILLNPYPVFPGHLTIVHRDHLPQSLRGRETEIVDLADELRGYTVFYNGASAGASAPDHCHFQAVDEAFLPLDREFPFKVVRGVGSAVEAADGISRALGDGDAEISCNVAVHCRHDGVFEWVVVPRVAHRPSCYPGVKVSPGAIDMLGTVITISEADYEAVDGPFLERVFAEVAFGLQPVIKVGIVTAPELRYSLHGEYRRVDDTFYPLSPDCFFEIENVVIGREFHWEQSECQRFKGALQLMKGDAGTTAVNLIPVEDYIESVISSEMSAGASPALLRAHAVISRSWLLAQLRPKSRTTSGVACVENGDEIVKWYDHDDHVGFDVCADDHCQRYQGITRVTSPEVAKAVVDTRGEVLMDGDSLCDARFSKCCGGAFEEFENCWEPVHHSCLEAARDIADGSDAPLPDLTTEEAAGDWIMSSPDSFCARATPAMLARSLNRYDRATDDFYRWRVHYTVQELSRIVKSKSGIDFGEIQELRPLARGTSGRISRLLIVGSRCSKIVGKELEIRKWLSESHLYSSAFVPVKNDDGFTLYGAGWGHGVGLCQIGAAVMGEEGYDYRQILFHYFKNATIIKRY